MQSALSLLASEAAQWRQEYDDFCEPQCTQDRWEIASDLCALEKLAKQVHALACEARSTITGLSYGRDFKVNETAKEIAERLADDIAQGLKEEAAAVFGAELNLLFAKGETK